MRDRYAVLIMVAVIILLTLISAALVYAYSGAVRERDIAQANERAALDTTRTYLLDSLRAQSRLLTQQRIRNEDLDAGLRAALEDRDAQARTVSRLQVAFDSVTALDQTASRDTVYVAQGDTVREATFEMQGPPIEGTQVVRVTRPRIALDSRLRVSPFSLTYSVGCADHDAVVSWSTPDWVSPSFQDGQVDPAVCNPLQPGLFHIDAGDGVAFAAGAGTVLLLRALLSR